jgi:GR25 family glycosyltransferase involved in LPS biosynthesis
MVTIMSTTSIASSSQSPTDPIFAHTILVHARNILGEQRGTSVMLLINTLGKLTESTKLEVTGDADPNDELVQIIKNEGTKILDLRPETFPNICDNLFRSRLKPLHTRQISNALKHLQALKIISKTTNTLPFSLIIEDDALFTAEVETQLREVVKIIPDDADIVFVSLPTPIQSEKEPRKAFVSIDGLFNQDLPSCDSYIIRNSVTEKICNAYLPIRLHTPSHLRYLIAALGLRAYVATSNIFVDGSKIGIFPSSIDINNVLLWNPPYCRLLDAASSPQLSDEDLKKAMQTEKETQSFSKHPDVLALRSRCAARLGNFKEAKELAEQAMEGFEQGGALFNDSSLFLRNYMSLFGNLQEE